MPNYPARKSGWIEIQKIHLLLIYMVQVDSRSQERVDRNVSYGLKVLGLTYRYSRSQERVDRNLLISCMDSTNTLVNSRSQERVDRNFDLIEARLCIRIQFPLARAGG
jgi:hypothetical protein